MSEKSSSPQPASEYLTDIATILAKGIIRLHENRQEAVRTDLMHVPLESHVCARETGLKQCVPTRGQTASLRRQAQEEEI